MSGHPRRTRVRALAGGAVLVALLGACSDPATSLDQAATEQAVLAAVAGRLVPVPDEVRCPSIDRGEGEVVTCRAVLPDDLGSVRVEVRQTDDDAGLDVELVDAIVDKAVVAEQLHSELVDAYGRTFGVTCGDPGPTVVAPGEGFDCLAADDDGARTIRAEVVDGSGTVTFDIGEPLDEEGEGGGSTAPTTTTLPAGSAPA